VSTLMAEYRATRDSSPPRGVASVPRPLNTNASTAPGRAGSAPAAGPQGRGGSQLAEKRGRGAELARVRHVQRKGAKTMHGPRVDDERSDPSFGHQQSIRQATGEPGQDGAGMAPATAVPWARPRRTQRSARSWRGATKAAIEPTERSMPPETMTKVIPSAMIRCRRPAG